MDDYYKSSKFFPKDIARLINEYVKNRGYKTAIDPFPGWDSDILSELVLNKTIGKGTVFTNNAKYKKITDEKHQNSDTHLNTILGDNLIEIQGFNETVDTIICLPPFNLRRENKLIKFNGKEINVNDNYENIVLFSSLQYLKNGGEAIFVLLNKSLLNQHEHSFINNLKKQGFFINSIIKLYPGIYSPVTSVVPNIVVISKNDLGGTFLAKYYKDYPIETFVKNWQGGVQNSNPELGLIAEVKNFIDVDSELSFAQLIKSVEEYPFEMTELKKIITKIVLGSYKKGIESFEDLPNSLFIPSIGTGPVITKISQLKIKPQNYIQVLIDPNKALVEYVTGFLNTPLGIKLRDLFKTGNFIARMTKDTVMNLIIPLPNIEEQTKMVSLSSDIEQKQGLLSNVRNKLWENPQNIETLKQEMTDIIRGGDFDYFIKQLPFPVASILRRYYVEDQLEKKLDYLLFFFEALTEFLATIILSSYYFDESHKDTLQDILKSKEDKKVLRRTTFGGWSIIASNLSKKIRLDIEKDQDNIPTYKEMLKISNTDILNALVDKDLYSTLEQISKKRNDWKGHTAPTDDDECKTRINFLSIQLQKIQDNLLRIFSNYELIIPLSIINQKGLFITKVQSVVGSDLNFYKKEVSVIKALDSTQLYFQERGQLDALQLIPFVRLMEAPKSELNSCYFYNRTEREGQRLLSYHYEKESEALVKDEILNDILTNLTK